MPRAELEALPASLDPDLDLLALRNGLDNFDSGSGSDGDLARIQDTGYLLAPEGNP